MIIYKITDGLGNQLFQYATARALASRNNDDQLYLDAETFYTLEAPLRVRAVRQYLLHHYNIRIRGYASRQQISRLSGYPAGNFAFPLRYSWWRFRLRRGSRLPMIALPNTCLISRPLWDESVMTRSGDNYIQAFGQCWHHLVPIEHLLRRELKLKNPPAGLNAAYAERILSHESVSLHVRRGDYLDLGYAVCSQAYFDRATALARQRLPNARFFVFSDDPNWARSRFGNDSGFEVVDHNDAANAHEDLRLMSLCRANIIANSTFSWWGAWLNQHPQRFVICPSVWKRGESSSHMLVPGWEAVDA